MLKDLLVVHYNAIGVFNDNETVDVDFGHWFEPKLSPGEEKWTGMIPVTFRIETRKEDTPVLTYDA